MKLLGYILPMVALGAYPEQNSPGNETFRCPNVLLAFGDGIENFTGFDAPNRLPRLGVSLSDVDSVGSDFPFRLSVLGRILSIREELAVGRFVVPVPIFSVKGEPISPTVRKRPIGEGVKFPPLIADRDSPAAVSIVVPVANSVAPSPHAAPRHVKLGADFWVLNGEFGVSSFYASGHARHSTVANPI